MLDSSHPSLMTSSRLDRLINARQEFYAAYSSGEDALDRFAENWQGICAEIQQQGAIWDSESAQFAWDVAQEVMLVAENLADLESKSKDATADFLGKAFSLLSLDNFFFFSSS